MSSREFWAKEAAFIRNTLHSFDTRDAVLGREATETPSSSNQKTEKETERGLKPGIYVNWVGDIGLDISKKGDTKPNVYILADPLASPIPLGSIGEMVDINQIYTNLLNQNIAIANNIVDPFEFKKYVTDGGLWDYKARFGQKGRKNTIYGLVNNLRNTQFSFNGESMRGEDVGNHHFGVMALAVKIPWSEEFILSEAGANQMSKPGHSKPEWQILEITTIPQRYGPPVKTQRYLPPYGDDPIDQKWIMDGFKYYKNIRK